MAGLPRVTIITGGPGPEHVASIESALGVWEHRDVLAKEFQLLLHVITENDNWLNDSASVQYIQAYSNGGMFKIHQDISLEHTSHQLTTPYEVLSITDVVFPVIHGLLGEDGVILGLCRALQKPYIGCGILTSAMCLDKAVCNAVLKQAGIPQTPGVVVLASHSDDSARRILQQSQLNLPWIVKPSDGGCSIGISLVHHPSELGVALAKSREKYPTSAIVVETSIQNMMEIDIAVLEKPGQRHDLITSACGLRKNHCFDKSYNLPPPQETHRHGGVPDWAVPAPNVSDDRVRYMQMLAKEVFRVVRATCWLRVDFFYLPSTGDCYVNEINTTPSLAPGSMVFKLWSAAGISPPELIRRVIRHGMTQQKR